MKLFFTRLIILITLVLIPLMAQGNIQGVVRDSLDNSPLYGANVIILGTSLGCATNIEGEYKITRVPDGTYQIKISYVGYQSKTFTVKILDNKTTQLKTFLSPDIYEGETVLVTAQALGQAAAINQQLTSKTIVNVISEEKIQELPDANAAEAIGRLPGVALQRSGGEANKVVLRGLSDKFSSITIDGVRMAATDVDSRGVDLSTISQGSLAGIELYKALTPDKDADAIAGSVNLVTKKAPVDRVIKLDAKGAYNKLNNTANQYDFAIKYGERFFSNLLGVQITANIEQKDRSNEQIDLDHGAAANNLDDYEITDLSLVFNKELRKRNGLGILLDIETPDEGSIKINNIINNTKRDYIRYSRNYPTNGAELFYSARDREQEIQTYNGSIRGDNHLFGFDINWSLSYNQSKAFFPYDFTMNFIEPPSTDASGTPISHMKNFPNSVLKGPAELLIPYALNNFQKSYLYSAFDRDENNFEKEKTAFLDISKSYTLSRLLSGEIKAGGKYRAKSRYKDQAELLSPYYLEDFRSYYKDENGNVYPKNLTGTRFENLQKIGSRILFTNFLDSNPETRNVYEKYLLNPLINRDALRLWRQININGVRTLNGAENEFQRNIEADAYHYDILERVTSAYLMNTLNIGQDITFIAGLRVEMEDNEYKSRYSPKDLSGFPTPLGMIRDTTAAHTETVWLPNFHVTLRPTDFLNVRLAAYKALARPDFNHRLESFVARRVGTFYPGNSLYIGNPNLKAAKAWNFEINTSVYGNEIGLFSVSLFYKEIKDMFHSINGVQVIGQGVLDSLGITYKQPFANLPYYLGYPYNSDKPTKVWGIEIEHQTNLGFLPGLLKNIVLSYNLSFVRSETFIKTSELIEYTLPGPFPIKKYKSVIIESKEKLEGQPELFGNVAIGYDISGFSARLSVFFQSQYNRTFSGNRRSDSIVNDFSRWDLALKQTVTDYLTILLNINNLTNFEEGTSTKNRILGWELLNSSEKYGLNADLGVRVTL